MYDRDVIERYTPHCIFRDALKIVPIHGGGDYCLLKNLFYALLTATSPPYRPQERSQNP